MKISDLVQTVVSNPTDKYAITRGNQTFAIEESNLPKLPVSKFIQFTEPFFPDGVTVPKPYFFTFNVPSTFVSLVKFSVLGRGSTNTAAQNFNFISQYAAQGEPFNQHSQAGIVNFAIVLNINFEIDITSVLTSLAVGDVVGIEINYVNGSIEPRAFLMEYL